MGWRYAGPWVRLMSNYYDDEAIEDVGPMAELLFIRSLAYSASAGTDGFVSTRRVRKISNGLDEPAQLAASLVDVGLWERDDERDGYLIRQWLKYNRSNDEISKHRSRDAARKRSAYISARRKDGVRADSPHQDRTESPVPRGTGQDSLAVSAPDEIAKVRATLRDVASRGRARRIAGTA